ncbi:MAG: permease [Marinagarivorans sp.]|nr:permease [Marinagarivorans sp.]
MSCCSPTPPPSPSPEKKSTSSCCAPKPAAPSSSCCVPKPDKNHDGCCDTSAPRDVMLWGGLLIVGALYLLHFFTPTYEPLHHAAMAVFELVNTMAWGVAFGVVMVAMLAYVPREWVMAVMGTNTGFKGLLRATAAGVALDLCSHGILMVGAKLYERGASLGQVMAFLIASPWNSFSLTLIMIAMIGLKWTLIFIVLSLVIALIAGALFDLCVARGILPANPNTHPVDANFRLWPAVKASTKSFKPSLAGLGRFVLKGIKESRMVIRWLLVGIILASAIRAFVPADAFGSYFGPTLLGLAVTLLVATVLEVCSEGSTPIAADIFTRAAAPGNSFAFLMAGVATDYTEVMVIKSTTRSWKIALFLPLLVLPQVVVLGVLLNQMMV